MKRSWILISYILKMTRRKSIDYIWNYLTLETRPTWFWSRAWKAKRFASGSIGGGWWLFLLLYCGYFYFMAVILFTIFQDNILKIVNVTPMKCIRTVGSLLDYLRFSIRALTLRLRMLFSSLFLRRNVYVEVGRFL